MNDGAIVLKILSQTQLDFIKFELGIDEGEIGELDDDAISDMYDKLCDIEVDETAAANEERNGQYSERERMVEGIVTLIGNTLYRPEAEPEE